MGRRLFRCAHFALSGRGSRCACNREFKDETNLFRFLKVVLRVCGVVSSPPTPSSRYTNHRIYVPDLLTKASVSITTRTPPTKHPVSSTKASA